MDAGLRERPEARGWRAEVELVSGRRPRGLGVHGSEIVGRVLRAEALELRAQGEGAERPRCGRRAGSAGRGGRHGRIGFKGARPRALWEDGRGCAMEG